MPPMIFVNIPVRDLKNSMRFYEALGYKHEPQYTDDCGACIVISDTIHVMLLTHHKFKEFTPKQIADSTKVCEVLLCLSCDSREAVDGMVATALAAGGLKSQDPKDHGFMYQHSFQDPDGHMWEVVWMNPAAQQRGEPDPGISSSRHAESNHRQELVIAGTCSAIYSALTTLTGIRSWWTADCEGGTAVGDHFTVRFGKTFKTMRLEVLRPDVEVRWSVVDSHLDVPGVLKRTNEWVGTTIAFRLFPKSPAITQVELEHIGLTPESECFNVCSQGWAQFLGSLKQYVETGVGSPFVAAGPASDSLSQTSSKFRTRSSEP